MEKKCYPKLEQTTALPSHEQRLRMFSSQTPLTSGRCRKVDFLELTRVESSEIRAEARSLSSVLPLTPASGSENQNKGLGATLDARAHPGKPLADAPAQGRKASQPQLELSQRLSLRSTPNVLSQQASHRSSAVPRGRKGASVTL